MTTHSTVWNFRTSSLIGVESTQNNNEEIGCPEQKETIEEVDMNILIPDSENGVITKKGSKGIFLVAAGGIIFCISVLIELTVNLMWWNEAAPIYGIITGLHIIFLGVFQHFNPKERTRFELMINGSQITSSIPFRNIILASINFIFSMIGIIYFLSTIRPYWNWPVWNILGLTMSLLIAVVTVIHLCSGHLPSKYKTQNFIKSMSSHPNIDGLDKKLQDLVTSMAATTIALFPEFSNINLAETIQVPKTIRRKALHHTTIALSMLLAGTMFSTQFLDITVSPKNEYNEIMSDPKCTYERNWVRFLNLVYSPFSAKLMVLISTPITVLLCLPLLLLTHRPSVVKLITAFIFSGAMAGFHCYQATTTMSWMIIMGSSVSPLTYILRLGITLASPILSSLLLSLTFSYLNTILQKEELENHPTTCCINISSSLTKFVAMVSISWTMAALIFTTGSLTVLMQGYWNSDQSGHNSDCTGQSWVLEIERYPQGPILEDNVRFFSLAQFGLSLTLLTLGLLVVLSDNKISRPLLLLFGLTSFASTIATLFSFFTGVFDYANEIPNLFAFYIFNGSQIILGLIIGLGFSFAGCSFFVTFFSVLLRTILAIVALATLLVTSLVVNIFNLSKLGIKKNFKEQEEPKQELQGTKIESEA